MCELETLLKEMEQEFKDNELSDDYNYNKFKTVLEKKIKDSKPKVDETKPLDKKQMIDIVSSHKFKVTPDTIGKSNVALKNGLEKVLGIKQGKLTTRNIEELYKQYLEENTTKTTQGSSTDTDNIFKNAALDIGAKYSIPNRIDLGTDVMNTFTKLAKIDIGVLKTAIHLTPSYKKHVKDITEAMSTVLNGVESNLNLQITATDTESVRGTRTVTKNKLTDEVVDTEINVLGSVARHNASMAETFLHETLHSLFQGLKETNPKVFDDMRKLKESLLEAGASKELFLQQIQHSKVQLTEFDLQVATDTFNYIFSKESDIEEFAAYVMSNSFLYANAVEVSAKPTDKPFIAITEDTSASTAEFIDVLNTMVSSIKDSVMTLFNAISGKKQVVTGKDVMEKMLTDIKTINEKAKTNANFLTRNKDMPYVGWLLNLSNTTFTGYQMVINFLQKNVGLTANSYLVKGLQWLYGIRDKALSYTKGRSNGFVKVLDSLPIIGNILRSGVIQSLYRSVTMDTANGEYKDFFVLFRKANEAINKSVHDVKVGIMHLLQEQSIHHTDNLKINTIFTESIIQTGLASSYYQHFEDSMFTDADIRNKRLDELSTQLIKLDAGKATIKHLDALAKFNVTGDGAIVNQQINTDNVINYTMGSSLSFEDFEKIIKVADEYTQLKTISELPQTSIDSIVESIMTTDLLDDMEKSTNLLNNYITKYVNNKRSRDTYNEVTELPMANLLHDDSTYTINYIEEDSIKDTLFDKITSTKVDNEYITINGGKYYKAKVHSIDTDYSEGAIKLTSTSIKGTSISDMIRHSAVKSLAIKDNVDMNDPKEVADMHKKIDKLVKLFIDNLKKNRPINKGLLDLGGRIPIPIYNEEFEVIDYKLPITKRDYVQHLNASNTIDNILPYTISRILNINIAKENNKIIANKIMSFSEENKDNKDMEFITVSPKSKLQIHRDAWDRLPKALKKHITSVAGKSEIKIPKEIFNQMVGFKEASIANLRSKNIHKKKDNIQQTIRFAEKIVKEILSYAKGVTILFNPDVWVGNTISNMTTAWAYGISPLEYYRQFKSSYQILTEYENLVAEQKTLLMKTAMGDDVSKQLQEVVRQMRLNKFHELADDGQFTPMVDNLEGHVDTYIGEKIDDKFKGTEDGIKRELHRIAVKDSQSGLITYEDALKRAKIKAKKSNKLPSQLNTGRKFLFGLKGSSPEKIATKFITYGDTITKQMILEQRRKEFHDKYQRTMSKKDNQRLYNELDMLLVNYGYLSNKYQSWAEKVGGLFFMKYLLKGLKGYHILLDKKPVNVGYQQGLQMLLGIDIADPLDTYIGKDMTDSIINREQLLHPLDLAYTATTPNVFMPLTGLEVSQFVK
jgi:hypothetical protein